MSDQPYPPYLPINPHAGETAEWMQNWAAEINLSETAFLTKKLSSQGQAGGDDGGPAHEYALRWFTPAVEVDVRGGVHSYV